MVGTMTASLLTERQASYIRSLKVELGRETPDEEALMALSRKEASGMIDALLTQRAGQRVLAAVTKVEEDPQAAEEAAADPVFSLPQGYFTVQFGEAYDGEETHRTFRVKDASARSKLAGKRIISLLTGSFNETDYTGVGFVTEGGVSVWRRFKDESVLQDAIRILTEDPEMAAKGFAMASGNCWCCNKMLTVPLSIERGVGPECWKTYGGF